MYVKYPKGEITLWCDGRSDEGSDTGSWKKSKTKQKKNVRQMERLLQRDKRRKMK